MNKTQIQELQRRIGTDPDGFWGPASIAACKRHLKRLMPSPNPWPKTSSSALRAFYGEPGDESNLVSLPAPVPMYYEGKKIRTIRCHKLVADSLARALTEAHRHHPKVVGDYSGCFNFRRMRGGSSYSLHAYGAAIDLDAGNNGNRTHWPLRATMPIEVMEAFAGEGWMPAGAFWSRDAMHFQSTSS